MDEIPKTGRVAMQSRGFTLEDFGPFFPCLVLVPCCCVLTPFPTAYRWSDVPSWVWGLISFAVGVGFTLLIRHRRLKTRYELRAPSQEWFHLKDLTLSWQPIAMTLGCFIGALVHSGEERGFLLRALICGLGALGMVLLTWRKRRKYGTLFTL